VLVPRVQAFVRGVIDEHRRRRQNSAAPGDNADFVDVLLSLEGDEKLGDDDMVAVLWVSFRSLSFFNSTTRILLGSTIVWGKKIKMALRQLLEINCFGFCRR